MKIKAKRVLHITKLQRDEIKEREICAIKRERKREELIALPGVLLSVLILKCILRVILISFSRYYKKGGGRIYALL